MAFVSFRKVRGLIVFLPFLKLMIADRATPDWRERRLVENFVASARAATNLLNDAHVAIYAIDASGLLVGNISDPSQSGRCGSSPGSAQSRCGRL